MTSVDAQRDNWFMYFPGNYRWSAAVTALLGSGPYGASDIGEVDRAGRSLRNHLGDDQAWFEEWTATGDRVCAIAEDELASGHRLTASNAFLRACNYYQMGERFRSPKDDAALDVFRRSVDSFHRFAELTDRPRVEVIEVPYEDGHLPAYFVHAENTDEERPSCVVYFDGLDITKELQFSRGVPDLVRRGISCLVVDGPGTGEAIRFRGYTLRAEYEVAGTAALEYLLTRDDVDPDRIGIMALSLGGYYAPRCAAKEPRYKACVAWGAIWDYHATWQRRIEAAFNMSMSVPGGHLLWVLGVDSYDEALTKLEDFRLDGVVQDLKAPFLITHGTEDEQTPLSDAEALFKAAGSADKTLRLFGPEEGGAQHCQRDYPVRGRTVIFDWLAEKL